MTRRSVLYLVVLLFSFVALYLLPACSACESTALMFKGTDYYNEHQYDKALDCFNRAIELDPLSGVNRVGRGRVYIVFARYEEALADFDIAIKLDPKYADGYFQKGQVLEIMDDREAAIEYYSKAIELESDSAYYYFIRGSAYRDLDRNDEAIADFRKSCGLGETLGCMEASSVWEDINKKQE